MSKGVWKTYQTPEGTPRPPTPEELDKDLMEWSAGNIYIDEYRDLCLGVLIRSIEDFTQFGVEGEGHNDERVFLNTKIWLFTDMEHTKGNCNSLLHISDILNIDVDIIRKVAKKARKLALDGKLKIRKNRGEVKPTKQLDMFFLMAGQSDA